MHLHTCLRVVVRSERADAGFETWQLAVPPLWNLLIAALLPPLFSSLGAKCTFPLHSRAFSLLLRWEGSTRQTWHKERVKDLFPIFRDGYVTSVSHQPAVREGRPADVRLCSGAGDPGRQNATFLHRKIRFCGAQTPLHPPPPRPLLLCDTLAPWYVHLTEYICNFAAAVVWCCTAFQEVSPLSGRGNLTAD